MTNDELRVIMTDCVNRLQSAAALQDADTDMYLGGGATAALVILRRALAPRQMGTDGRAIAMGLVMALEAVIELPPEQIPDALRILVRSTKALLS